jgi:hypothetical protein
LLTLFAGFMLHMLLAVFLAGPLPAVAAATDALPAINAKAVEFSPALHNGVRTGDIRILGLLELPSSTVNGVRFAELSDLAWDDDDGVLYAVSDQGSLFWLKPVFTREYLTDVRLLKATQLKELRDGKGVRWKRTDAEGMDILKGRNGRKRDAELVISFEREPRILRYRTDGTAISQHTLQAPLDSVGNYAGANKALEAVCSDPDRGLLTAPELPLRSERAGYTRIFDMTGKSWYYPVTANGGIVAMDCPGNGELLVLERDYMTAMVHTIITLKRARLAGTAPGATLETRTLMRLDRDQGIHLDNFEGLTHHRGNRYFMVSDNNDVFLQRTLLLYFEIIGE